MNRTLLIAGLVAGAVALTAWALLSGGGAAPRAPQGLELEEAIEAPVKQAPDPVGPSTLVARSDAEQFAKARLEVVVKDPRGVRLENARVLLTQDETGASLQQTGHPTFQTLAPGTWTLRVEHPEFLAHVERLDLEPGARERVEVRLFESLKVTGTVKDRFGRTMAGRFIWFLRPEDRYPGTLRQAEGLIGGLIQPTGTFQADLPSEVDLRLVVGRPGSELWSAPEPVRVAPGDPLRAEVVVAGATNVQVRMQSGAANARPEDKLVSIAVLGGKDDTNKRTRNPTIVKDPVARQQALLAERQAQRRKEREERGGAPLDIDVDPENNKGPRGGRLRQQRQDRLKARQERLAAGQVDTINPAERSRRETAALSAQAQAQHLFLGQTWTPLRTASMTPGTPLDVPLVPTGRDLRLRLIRRLESIDSELVFRAVADATLVVEFDSPLSRAERGEGVPAVLPIRTWVEPLPSDAPAAGVHWH